MNASDYFNCTTGVGGMDAGSMISLDNGFYYNATDDAVYSCDTWEYYSSWQVRERYPPVPEGSVYIRSVVTKRLTCRNGASCGYTGAPS